MSTRLTALAFLAAAAATGCAGAASQPKQEASVASPAADDCTLDTPLIAGAPGSPGHLIPSEVNPNGDSELGALMRAMGHDMERIKADIEAGKGPGALPRDHRRIRCAWPTDPEVRDVAYDAMAQAYLRSLDHLHAGAGDPKARFDAVLDSCVGCHTAYCPGPITRIEGLRFAANANAPAPKGCDTPVPAPMAP
jgi:hypothetical protein